MIAHRFLALPVALLFAGCNVDVHTGPARTEPVSLERDSAEFVHANLMMKAGSLRLSGGAAKLVEGEVTYSGEAAKPVVKYVSAANHGNLSIEPPQSGAVHIGSGDYRWDLRLSNDVPLDLKVDFGAGEARMDLGSLQLRTVEIAFGAGKLDLDLRGSPKRSYEVRIRGGVGEAVVRLPRDVGIYAKATGGIGSIDTTGLKREGDHLINDAYDNSKATIRLDIHGGIGQIRLISE